MTFDILLWNYNLKKVKLYINKNNCKPFNNKILTKWIYLQKNNYKNKKYIMKNDNIRIKWENFINKYKYYFLNNNEKWNKYLEKVKIYIKENKCKPSQTSKNNNIKKLGKWINDQFSNYKTNDNCMKDNNIKIKWEEFINIYKEYLYTNEEKWNNNLEKVILYINKYNSKPLFKSIEPDIKQLRLWLDKQLHNYKNNKYNNNNYKIKWQQFISKYKEYFLTNEEIWNNNLEKVKLYIDENKSKPSIKNNKQLAYWITNQQKKYKKNKQIMNNIHYRIKWEEFIKKYY